MKSYTDLEQSKKLAEMLPLESADMYRVFENNSETRVYYGKLPTAYFVCEPCWSLAALLSVLPKLHKLQHSEEGYYCSLANYKYITETYNNPVDACYEMILKLNELNLL